MMTLWTKILRNGAITTNNSRLVFATNKTLHQCAKQREWNLVKFPKQRKFLSAISSSSNFSSHQNCRSVSSTPIENTDKDDLLQSDSSNSNSDDQAPVEWTGEQEEFTLTLSDEEIQQLSDGDPEIIKKIRYIQLEHEICRQEGQMVPTMPLKLRRWEELLACNSKGSRIRYYEFVFKLEKIKENAFAKKAVRRQEYLLKQEAETLLPKLSADSDDTTYGLHRNTLFVRLYDTTIHEFYYHRLAQECMFGQPLVLDCGFGQYMSFSEIKSCTKQLEYTFGANREHSQPFDLHFCNVHDDDPMVQSLYRCMPHFCSPDVPLNITSNSYLDKFPREKLVYLTTQAHEYLEEFNHDDVYILDCIVDKVGANPVGAANAKRENIRMRKLPIDRYLDWGIGNKRLPLNHYMSILLDQKKYNDWNKSFIHIPKRKLKGGRKEYYPDREQGSNVFTAPRSDRMSSNFSRGDERWTGEPTQHYSRSIRDQSDYASGNYRKYNNRHSAGGQSYPTSNDNDYNSRNKEFRSGNYSNDNYYNSNNNNYRNREFRDRNYSIPRSNDNYYNNNNNNNRNREFRGDDRQGGRPDRRLNVRTVLIDPDD